MVVSILGCGWYGSALANALLETGFIVKGSVTSAEKLSHLAKAGIIPYLVRFEPDSQIFDPAFFACDLLVVAIPPGFKNGDYASYPSKIRRICSTLQQMGIRKVIYISSTGVYGDDNQTVTEMDDPGPDTQSGRSLLQAEALVLSQTDWRLTIIRFGGLVGPGRHPGRFFSGKKKIPNGQAPVNLIHLDDCLGITSAVISQNAFGYRLNACSADHPPKMDFYSRAARNGGYPAPEFIDELRSWKIVNSVLLKPVLDYESRLGRWADYLPDA